MRSAKVQCSIELIAFTLFMSKPLLVESFPLFTAHWELLSFTEN